MGGHRFVRSATFEKTKHSRVMTPSSTLIGHPGASKEEVSGHPHRASPEPICAFLHQERGSLTFYKVSINGQRARQRVVTRQAQRHRAEAEPTEELPPLQQRKARTLNRATEKQHNCTLRSPKWATIDETRRKRVRAVVNGSVGEKLATVSPFMAGMRTRCHPCTGSHPPAQPTGYGRWVGTVTVRRQVNRRETQYFIPPRSPCGSWTRGRTSLQSIQSK